MVRSLLIVALFASRSVVAQELRLPATAARALVDSLAAAELRFFQEWGQVWRLSEDSRGGTGRTMGAMLARNDSTRPRNQHLHCHPGAAAAARSTAAALAAIRPGQIAPFSWQVRAGSMIQSREGMFAVCPTWIFEQQVDDGDERISIDAGLTEQFRVPVTVARKSLIGMFDAAARLVPANDWIVGQHIRLLLDARMTDSALTVAIGCRASKWWCASLTGYVLARAGRIRDADSVFDDALAGLSLEERCRWTNYSAIIDSAARKTYASLTCAQRDSVHRVLWWLADPLFTVPANERRVEQFSRTVNTALRRALDRDERFDWRYAAGGDALEEMVARYGWPTYLWWGGPSNDRSHSGYLKGFKSPLHEPYTTFEYSRRRQHLLPSWDAVLRPTAAKGTSWEINPPDSAAELAWWPAEHYAARRPLLQLPVGQMVVLRRDTAVILATSTSIERAQMRRAPGARVDAMLVITDRPGALRVVSEVHAPVSSTLVLYGLMPSSPTLVGIEVLPDSSTASFAARDRFGLTPPLPLSAMSVGEVAMSDPVVLVAPAGDDPAPIELNAAMQSMASSTRVPVSRKIAVYWETYGFGARDTVDVAVWIERYTAQGVLRRFSNALTLTTDLNTPVAITWREPQPGNRALVTNGRIPIVARSVVLDLAKLPRGEYWLDVAVAKPGQPPVRSRRSIRIE